MAAIGEAGNVTKMVVEDGVKDTVLSIYTLLKAGSHSVHWEDVCKTQEHLSQEVGRLQAVMKSFERRAPVLTSSNPSGALQDDTKQGYTSINNNDDSAMEIEDNTEEGNNLDRDSLKEDEMQRYLIERPH